MSVLQHFFFFAHPPKPALRVESLDPLGSQHFRVLNTHGIPRDMPAHHERSSYFMNKSTQTFFKDSDHVVESTNKNQHLDGDSKLKTLPNLNVYREENLNQETQTEFNHEFVFSVQQNFNMLPIVDLILANLNFPFLIDSGSSICIIDADFFHSIKSFVNSKFLARAVTISTINSDVKFSGCVNLSFKIEKQQYKHNFYLVDIPQKSNFKGILGTDFLRKEAIVVDFNTGKIKIKDNDIPFKNSSLDNQNSAINILNEPKNLSNVLYKDIDERIMHCNVNNVNENNSSVSQQVHINQKSGSPIIARSLCKVILPPKQQVFIQAKCSDEYYFSKFLFEPCLQSRHLVAQCSVHTLNREKQLNDSICSQLSEKSSNEEAQQIIFMIPIENKSDKNFHINKNQKIGEIFEIDEIKESNVNSESQNFEQLNLIQANEHIKKLRDQEFNIENFKITHLCNQERTRFSELLSKFKQVFATSLLAMGHTDLVVPTLNFDSEYPRRSPPFPIPQILLKDTKQQLDEMLQAGVISKTISDWSSPLLLVKKKPGPDGKQTYRLALDLRLINTIITQSAYPLPKIQDIINNISQYKFYSNLDLQSAYHQIDLPHKYRPILAFNTPFGAYCYNRLVFGLKNSAAIFQHMIDKILEEVNVPGIFAYQDDIVVASNSFDETIEKLTKLFTCFEKYNLTLSPTKCNFHNTKINYLGFEISQNIITPIEQNITKITGFPLPNTKRKMKKFLGLCGFYRHLIPKFAHLTAQLNNLTTPKAVFKLTDEHKKAFNELQQTFFNKPFLRQPNWHETFYLNTDASSAAISACLMQKFEGELLPVSYFSKTLNRHEKNYPAIKLELMAIVKSIHAFKYYLYNREFVILSDSEPLKHYKKISSPTDLTTRWLMSISEYTFKFTHIPGQKNVLADYFSRIPEELPKQDINSHPEILHSKEILPVEERCHLTQIQDNNIREDSKCQENASNKQKSPLLPTPMKQDPLLEISTETFHIHQRKAPELKQIFHSVQNNKNDNKFKNFFICKNNLLLYKYVNISSSSICNSFAPKLVVPKSLVPKILRIMHVSHLGISKTYELIQQRYFWFGMYRDTKEFVESCQVCLQSKPQRIPMAPFQNTFIPKHPGEMVSMDLVGVFKNGQYILTIIDIFSRHLEMYTLRNITAQNITENFLKYISTHGRPSQVLCDLGTQFTAEIFKHINAILHINLIHTSAAHPQANAISERINTSIKSTIKALQLEGHTFAHAVDLHKAIYNASKHPATQYSPNLIHFARDLSIFTDTMDLSLAPQNKTTEFKLFRVLEAMESIYKLVYDNLQYSQHQNQARQKSFKKLRKFKIGDMVYIKAPSVFKHKIDGPFQILKQTGPVNFLVQRFNNQHSKKFVIHVNRLILSRMRPDRLKEQKFSSPAPLTNDSQPSANNLSFQVEDVSHPTLPPVTGVEVQLTPDKSSPPVIDNMSVIQQYSPVRSTVDDGGPPTLSPPVLVAPRGNDWQSSPISKDVTPTIIPSKKTPSSFSRVCTRSKHSRSAPGEYKLRNRTITFK